MRQLSAADYDQCRLIGSAVKITTVDQFITMNYLSSSELAALLALSELQITGHAGVAAAGFSFKNQLNLIKPRFILYNYIQGTKELGMILPPFKTYDLS